MQTLDYVVLGIYFVMLIAIGIACSFTIKKQEDFFLGGRGFGKLLQTFAAFGAGTGAQDPINVGRTTWTSGLSGIWSALMWLFATPFYWIFAVWYRRMRHMTLGDWFVERYQSRAIGVAYTVFGFTFCILYLSTMFSAISKVAEPLLGNETIFQILSWFSLQENPDNFKYVMVPTLAGVVLIYGILGGLTAAYWTDLIQGLCIIALSCVLIPYGLWGLVDKYGDQYTEQLGPQAEMTAMDGFTIMHDRVTEDYFGLFSGPQAGEFPWYFIASLTALALVGIVVQPHFIAVGGGSAKTENSARVGLVTGNFLKRLCTIGWGLTALIALALLAGNVNAAEDPERVWGIASREILGPLGLGLVGLMLACLVAAAMSSADAYMLVTAGLLVRNVYAAYFNPSAAEKTYIRAGRLAGLVIIVGAAAVSMLFYSTLKQYFLALEVAIVFAAPFWIGMYWRRANAGAAWLTIGFSLCFFFIVPAVIPLVNSSFYENQQFAITNDIVTRVTQREATQVDVDRRAAQMTVWDNRHAAATEAQRRHELLVQQGADAPAHREAGIDQYESLVKTAKEDWLGKKALADQLGKRLKPLAVGDPFEEVFATSPEAIFWTGGVKPVGEAQLEVVDQYQDGDTQVTVQRHTGQLQGDGSFKLDFLVYHLAGVDLHKADKAMLATLRLPPRLILPFVVMILFSFITPRGDKEALDRYYVKMKTPVLADREADEQTLQESYADPARYDYRRMFPFFGLEIQKPTLADWLGFAISVGICFVFLWLAQFVAQIGS